MEIVKQGEIVSLKEILWDTFVNAVYDIIYDNGSRDTNDISYDIKIIDWISKIDISHSNEKSGSSAETLITEGSDPVSISCTSIRHSRYQECSSLYYGVIV